MVELPPRVFLTGTDTDVGKTVVAALLCRRFGLDYVKPVQSGTVDGTDTATVARLSGARTWPETWRLRNPKSPHRAAADDGVRLDPLAVRLPDAPRLLVEGAGGWMVPLAADPLVWQADLVRALGLPAVVVCRTTLGTLHHTSSTVRAIRADGVEVVGLVAVGPEHAENLEDLPRLTGAPLLAWVPRAASVEPLDDLLARVRWG